MTPERIEECLAIMAHIITLHNEPAYMPLFDLLEAELEKTKVKSSKMDRIARFAADRPLQNR